MPAGVHINLDNAWNASRLPLRMIDATLLGPHLRYTASQAQLEKALAIFKEALVDERFVLYGSGDYHYLAAWWFRALLEKNPTAAKTVMLVSFDNHPDWDIRPPRWACGGWINRALEMPQVAGASVWGCANFELHFPMRLFRNRKALRRGRLEVHGWAESQPPAVAEMFKCMTRKNWRERFSSFARSLAGRPVYVTIDLDALAAEHAITNWENGLFAPGDLAWALCELHARANIIGGDCCGAFSPPTYARRWQRFIGNFDHPRLPERNLEDARAVNHGTLDILWPALTANG